MHLNIILELPEELFCDSRIRALLGGDLLWTQVATQSILDLAKSECRFVLSKLDLRMRLGIIV